MLTSKVTLSYLRTDADGFSLAIDSMYHHLSEQLSTRRAVMFDSEAENATVGEQPAEQVPSVPAQNDAMVDGGGVISRPPSMTDTSSFQIVATPASQRSAIPLAAPISLEGLQFSLPVKASTSPIIPHAVAVGSTASQVQDTTTMVLSEPKVAISETSMKTELYDLLREMYMKYPGAQDDHQVEKMALSLKASLFAGEQDRVRELRMDFKAYLIAHHG